MGDKIIITDEEDAPKVPNVVVIEPKSDPKAEKVVTEKMVITETKKEE